MVISSLHSGSVTSTARSSSALITLISTNEDLDSLRDVSSELELSIGCLIIWNEFRTLVLPVLRIDETP